jgi:putative redox protein
MAHRNGSAADAATGRALVIRTVSLARPYTLTVTNGRQEISADAPIDKGGAGGGFGAHELLEAALAACLNMAVRMHAAQHTIPLQAVETRVSIVRPDPQTVRFEYALKLSGPLSVQQREALEDAARTCPVSRTLSKRLEFCPARDAT